MIALSSISQTVAPPSGKAAPTQPPGFIDFRALLIAVPLGERTLREEIKRKRIPAIRMPGGRRLLFHLPSVEKALLRFQEGGIVE